MDENKGYSVYSREQIVDNMYERICQIFLNAARSDEEKRRVFGILYDGGFDDFSVNGLNERVNRNNPQLEARRRIAYADLFLSRPETFDLIRKNDIVVFHGTNSHALPSIIAHGLRSVNKLNEAGIEIKTGEKWSRIQGRRSFISFTNDFNIAGDYASIGTSKGTAFPVVFGLSNDALKRQRTMSISSDVPEIGIRDGVNIEDIGFIGVPEDRVEYVRRIIGNDRIIVSAVNREEDRFYDAHPWDLFLHVRDKKAKQFIKRQTSQSSTRLIGKSDVAGLAKTRERTGISSIFSALMNKIKGRDSAEQGREALSHE